MNQTARRGNRNQVMMVFLLLLAFALRVWNLGGPSLWYDEAYLWWATRLPLGKMLALSTGELVPPLHYFVLRAWQSLAGTGEFALRFPSALDGILAVAALARIARRLTGRPVAATWALLLGAITTAMIWASRETRMYGAFIAWSLLAGMALIETLYAGTSTVRRRWAWVWGGALLGALTTLTLSAFWLIGQGLFALIVLLRRPRSAAGEWLRAMLPPTLVAGVIFLPWGIGALRSLGVNATYWAGHLPSAEFLRISIVGMTVSDDLPAAWKLTAGGVILLTTFPALFLTRRRPQAGLYPLLQLLPLGVMALIFRNLPKWGSRHASLFAPLPALALAIGWGMAAQLHNRRTRRLAHVGLGVCSLIFSGIALRADLNLLTDPAYATADWRSVAHYVAEHRAPGDVVIVETGSVFPAWAYYAGFEGLLPLPDDELLDVNHVLHYGNTAPALNVGLQGASGVWLVTWLDDITDPTGIVPALLGTLGPETPTPQFRGLGLRHFTLERRADFPAEPPLTARPLHPTLPGLTLWGYRLPENPQPVGAPLDVWAFWTTDAAAIHKDRFYQVVVRLLDARGDEWGRVNSTPGGGDYRPSRWPAATPILGRYALTPDPWTPPGVYTPTLTVYLAGGDSATVALQPLTLTLSTIAPVLPDRASPVEPSPGNGPLRLLGVWIGREEVAPCEQVEGWLYWEVAADASVYDLHVMIGVEEHRLEWPVVAESVDQAVPAGTRFATPFRLPIDCRALDTQAPLDVQLVAASGASPTTWRGPVMRIVAEREFALPTGLLSASGNFGPGIAALVGYTVEPELRGGEPFTVTLYWRAGETGDAPYSVFVHVTPPDAVAPIVAQHDSWPALGAKPTYTWVGGEIVADPHPLPGIAAGEYCLRVGLYDATGRLPLQGDAATASENAVVIPLAVAP
ncbi:MAG TPA: glycosyltransferase family 39 protein [Anaerolineae bacterium]|nr:glycosyltransferase family 39 protein [Anaerolineae bacterium]HQH39447.1 glycosyltransferase family 39 protein [Anaerolineae bacterium]